MSKFKKIESIEELLDKLKSKDEPLEFFIYLGNGVRSSKSIMYLGNDTFSILHEIDGHEDILTLDEIVNKEITNIPSAIERGLFFQY